jgi:hypothetical protein
MQINGQDRPKINQAFPTKNEFNPAPEPMPVLFIMSTAPKP